MTHGLTTDLQAEIADNEVHKAEEHETDDEHDRRPLIDEHLEQQHKDADHRHHRGQCGRAAFVEMEEIPATRGVRVSERGR